MINFIDRGYTEVSSRELEETRQEMRENVNEYVQDRGRHRLRGIRRAARNPYRANANAEDFAMTQRLRGNRPSGLFL